MFKETKNVGDMPVILFLRLHKSADSGRYYLNFVEYTKELEGIRTVKHITKQDAKILLNFVSIAKKSCLNCIHYNVCVHISESDDSTQAEKCNEFWENWEEDV